VSLLLPAVPGYGEGRGGGGADVSDLVRVNVQQFTRTPGIMQPFTAEPGHVLIGSDFPSLEPRVLAHYSGDATYRLLYASGLSHDPYLYNAAFLFPERRAAIDAVYRLDAPTPESVAAAKEAFKTERKIAKEVTLAAVYGASAKRIYQTMRVKGIRVTLDEVVAMREHYWRLYDGAKQFGYALRREARDRGGWIYNGRGRPLVVTDDKEKDILNLFCQSSGHDCLLSLVWHMRKVRDERKVPMRPWLVDLHDETIWTCPADAADAAAAVMREAYVRLQTELKTDIPLTGTVEVGQSLWDFKQ
jgi:DNA polymerase I